MSNPLGIPDLDINRLNSIVEQIPKNQFETPMINPGAGKTTGVLSTMVGEVEFGAGQVYGVFAVQPLEIEILKNKFKQALVFGLDLAFIEHKNKVQTKGQTWVFLTFGTYVDDYSFDGVFADVKVPYDIIGDDDRAFIDRVLARVK